MVHRFFADGDEVIHEGEIKRKSTCVFLQLCSFVTDNLFLVRLWYRYTYMAMTCSLFTNCLILITCLLISKAFCHHWTIFMQQSCLNLTQQLKTTPTHSPTMEEQMFSIILYYLYFLHFLSYFKLFDYISFIWHKLFLKEKHEMFVD